MHHAMALPMRRAVLMSGRLGVVTVPPEGQRRGGLNIVYNSGADGNEHNRLASRKPVLALNRTAVCSWDRVE